METAGIFVGIAALLVVSVLWLGAYLYALYALARWIGERVHVRRWPWLPFVAIGVASTFLASAALLVPVDWWSRFWFAGIVWLVHFHPMTVGFWVSQDVAKRRDRLTFLRKTEEWLSEWEETPKP